MFSTLPPSERQAFMALMDEYYASRPHLLPSGSNNAAAAAPAASNPYAAGAPPPARSGPTVAQAQTALAGLQVGKSLGKLNTSSASAAFGSMMGHKQPAAPAPAPASTSSHVPRAGPPPQPPSRAADVGLGKAVALYAYNGGEAEDLSVAENETVTLVERVSDDWWKARNARGQEGIVPATYIRQL